MTERLMVGAVAYDPKVVPIWEGIREYFRGAPVEMDFVLFSNYEAQVEALLAGQIDIAWNTNLAYVRVHRARRASRVARDARHRRRVLHDAGGPARRPRLDATACEARPWRSGARTRRRRRSCRSTTSRARGSCPASMSQLLRFDSDVGKHGDTGRSEREALEAVLDGRADAAAVGAASWDVLVRAGEVPPGEVAPFWTSPGVLALQLHRAADAGSTGRGRLDRSSASDGLDEPGPSADPRARGAPRMGRSAARRVSRPVRSRRGAGDLAGVVTGSEPAAIFDAEDLDLAGGLAFVLDVLLSDVGVGDTVEIHSRNAGLVHELPGWARGTGNVLIAREPEGDGAIYRIRRGERAALLFRDRPELGVAVPDRRDGFGTREWLLGTAAAIPERADPATGFAPRGAEVEPGAPRFPFTLTERDRVWATNVASLYDQATAQQWDASTDIRVGRVARPAEPPGAGRRAGDDPPRRERVRGAVRARSIHPEDPSALHRGRAVPVHADRRRGPAHRGVHEAGAGRRRGSRTIGGDHPGVAEVAARAGGFLPGVVPTVRPRRGCVPGLSLVRGAIRAGPRDRRHRASGSDR